MSFESKRNERRSLWVPGLVAASLFGTSHAMAADNWYNEPEYVNPGTEGLHLGLTPLAYPETSSNKFLGQYVCVDAEDRAVPGDPYTCTTSRRKLKIGEDLPYVRHGKTTTGKRVSVSNSVPLVFEDRIRFLNSRMSGSDSRVHRNYSKGDGYDITDNYRGYSFIYGTRDPETTSTKHIWCGEFGALGGGWMLWPDGIDGTDSDVFKIGGGDYGSCSPSGRTYTIWEAPAWRRFTSGKSLYSIKSLHFSTSSVATADGLEVFYQNTLYGAVRWEAWKPTPQDDLGKLECDGASTMVVEGVTFYRRICKDWTNVQQEPTPLHPYYVPLSTVFTTTPQKLQNADFYAGTQNWTLQSSQAGTITYAAAVESSKNPYLAITKSGSTVASVVQAVNGLGTAAYAQPVLQGGVLLKGPIGAEGVIGVVLSSSRASQQELKIRFTFKNSDWSVVRFHAESVHLTDPNVKMTFKFYPKDGGSYAMDEAFLAVLPKSLP